MLIILFRGQGRNNLQIEVSGLAYNIEEAHILAPCPQLDFFFAINSNRSQIYQQCKKNNCYGNGRKL